MTLLFWRRPRPQKGRVERLKETARDKRTHVMAGAMPVLIAIVARVLRKRTTEQEESQ